MGQSAGRMFQSRNGLLWRYPCTMVGYIRLVLLGGALLGHLGPIGDNWAWLRPAIVFLLGISRLLDLADGYLARKFGHTTLFGSLFDLTLDLTTHTIVWILSGFWLTPFLLILEWGAGLCVAVVALQPGGYWKTSLTAGSPGLIRAYFRANQRNPLSAYGNISHFVFPMAFYLQLPLGWIYYGSLPGLILYEGVTLYILVMWAKKLVKVAGNDPAG